MSWFIVAAVLFNIIIVLLMVILVYATGTPVCGRCYKKMVDDGDFDYGKGLR